MYAPEVNMRVFPGPASDAAHLALLRLAVAPREDSRPLPPRKRKARGSWSFIPAEFLMFCLSTGVFAGLYFWQTGTLQPWLHSAKALLAQIGIRLG